MERKIKKCYECCSAVVDKEGKLLGGCVYIAFPEKIVEKKSEYLPFNPDELITLAVEDGELVIGQLTDEPVQAVITGFGRFPGSWSYGKLPISKEEFLALLPEGKLNLEPMFFNYLLVKEARSAI